MAGWILSVALVWAIKKQRSMCVTQEAGAREETFEKIRGERIYLIPQEENYCFLHIVVCWYRIAERAPSGQKRGALFGKVSIALYHELKGRQGEVFPPGLYNCI